MALTTAFKNLLGKLAIGAAATPYNDVNSYIGVGDSAVAFAAAQTDLQAAANKMRKGMASGYPTEASGVMTFRATFAAAEANFAWNEWAIFNANAGGTMMNRKVEALGTKTSAQSWQLTLTITLGV